MSVIKNVVLAGAAGNIGSAILQSLLTSGKFNVTVFSRVGSESKFPSEVKVVEVDYSSLSNLTTALAGQDAVVSAFASAAVGGQNTLIDAAVAAGVKRFIPSDFGSNLDNAKTRALPVFTTKVVTQEYLIEKGEHTDLTYTFVYNGGFLDWGLKHDFVLRISNFKPILYNGGDIDCSTTTLTSVGDAVVGVLTHLEETKNRAVYISDVITTQNKLLALAQKVAPNKPWAPEVVSTDDIAAVADERLKKHLFDVETFMPYLFQANFDPTFGAAFVKNDNELLGVKGKTDEDIVEIFKGILN